MILYYLSSYTTPAFYIIMRGRRGKVADQRTDMGLVG